MDPEKIVSELEEKTDYAEVFFSRSSGTRVKTVKRKTEFTRADSDEYYQVRIVKGKKVGTCSFWGDQDPEKVINTVMKITEHSREYGDVFFPEGSRNSEDRTHASVLNAGAEDMAEEVVALAGSLDEKGIEPTQCGVSKSVEESLLVSSSGTRLEWRNSLYSAYATVSYKGTETWEERTRTKRFGLDEIRDRVLWLAASTCGGKRFSGETIVFMPPETVSELVEAFLAPAISQYNVLQKRSYFMGKIGELVVSEGLGVRDDPLIGEGLYSREFDPEGVKSRILPIIEEGVLENFVRDLRSCWLSGKEPTGHAHRSLGGVYEHPTNLVFSAKDVLKMEEVSGVMVRDVLGVHTCNHLTGDFSLEVSSGAVIKQGEPVRPVRNCVIVGNFFELLKRVSLAGPAEQRGAYVGPGWVFQGKIV